MGRIYNNCMICDACHGGCNQCNDVCYSYNNSNYNSNPFCIEEYGACSAQYTQCYNNFYCEADFGSSAGCRAIQGCLECQICETCYSWQASAQCMMCNNCNACVAGCNACNSCDTYNACASGDDADCTQDDSYSCSPNQTCNFMDDIDDCVKGFGSYVCRDADCNNINSNTTQCGNTACGFHYGDSCGANCRITQSCNIGWSVHSTCSRSQFYYNLLHECASCNANNAMYTKCDSCVAYFNPQYGCNTCDRGNDMKCQSCYMCYSYGMNEWSCFGLNAIGYKSQMGIYELLEEETPQVCYAADGCDDSCAACEGGD